MKLLLAVLAWPLTEIALFVLIGGQIGVWAVLSLVLLSAVLGVLVLRMTARRQALALRAGLTGLRMAEVSGGALALLAGVLLVLPGFLTDALGLLLLLPPVQGLILRSVAGRRAAAARPDWPGDVVEAEFVELDRAGRDGRPSKWAEGDGPGDRR